MAMRDVNTIVFGKVYPMYVQKAERKGRTQDEVDQVICWLTGYTKKQLQQQVAKGTDFASFFAAAPALHPDRVLVTGLICGVRIEDLEDPVTQDVRRLDKLVDELAKGGPMEKVLRQAGAPSPGKVVKRSRRQAPAATARLK